MFDVTFGNGGIILMRGKLGGIMNRGHLSLCVKLGLGHSYYCFAALTTVLLFPYFSLLLSRSPCCCAR